MVRVGISENNVQWKRRARIRVYLTPKKASLPYSPILIGHICAGTLGLLSGTAAMSFRKGSPRHVLAGRIFVASMLIMAVGRRLPCNRETPTEQHWRRDHNLLSHRNGMAHRQAREKEKPVVSIGLCS